jgi:superoxide oxidase
MNVSEIPPANAPKVNSGRPPFDNVTIILHWLTVLIVVTMFTSAWLRSQSHDDAFKATLLQIHRSLGVTIWVMTALRLAWRLTQAKLPPFSATMTETPRIVVRWTEYGFYGLLLIQPVTGIGTTLFGGRPFALFVWRIAPLFQDDKALQAMFRLLHEVGAWALAALIVDHAAAALIHHFVLRDDVLECVAPVIAPPRRLNAPIPHSVVREGNAECPARRP